MPASKAHSITPRATQALGALPFKNKSRCLLEAAGHEFRQCGLASVGEILDADHAAVFIEAIDDRRSGAQFALQDFFR